MLDSKGWTQDDLAAVTGYSRQTINGIISGKSRVTPDMAVALGAAFKNAPAEWLQWDSEHQLSLVEVDPAAVERKAWLYDLAPIHDMQKRGWIRVVNASEELESELETFFGGSLKSGIVLPVATHRSDPFVGLNTAERAWCFRAKQLAESVAYVAEFDASRMDAAEKKLRQLAAYPKEAERLFEILAYYGIRFVVVEPLPGARIDGAAFWIGNSPVIAVSIRWDRIDAFWFTVLHEFMHIKNGDAYSADVNLVREGDQGITVTVSEDAAEQRASDGASECLVPRAELDSFVRRMSPLYAAKSIVQFAHRIKMHPGIIIGQLQHRGELRYGSHRDHLVKVRKYVIDTAITDGWGLTISPSGS